MHPAQQASARAAARQNLFTSNIRTRKETQLVGYYTRLTVWDTLHHTWQDTPGAGTTDNSLRGLCALQKYFVGYFGLERGHPG